MLLVWNAERLNKLGARHWDRFAGQDYFDSSGIFTSALLSAPLVFDMVVILVRLHPGLCVRPSAVEHDRIGMRTPILRSAKWSVLGKVLCHMPACHYDT